MNRPARILVTDAGRGSAISIIRSLGRQGHQVIAADSDPNSLGFRSRYTSRSLLYPDPKVDVGGVVDTLLRALGQERVDLVVPVTDLTLQPLARNRQAFEARTRIAMPDDEALAQVTDKERTVQLARDLGVPTPETRPVRTVQEALDVSSDLGWPVVLKPQWSHKTDGQTDRAFQVTYASSKTELECEMARLEGHCTVLLQRYFGGIGYGVELLLSRGRPLAAFQHKRLREIPLTGGVSTYRESCALDPVLYDHATRLMGALGWTGLAMVEFKMGTNGVALMEINGRVWGSLPLAIVSGMDFPAHLARLYLEGEEAFGSKPLREYKIGVRSRDLPRDLMWISAILAQKRRYSFLPLPKRRRGVAAFLGLFDPRRKSDLAAWDDPMPGLLQIPRIVPRLLRKARAARTTP